MFTGSSVALVTPFKDGKIDEPAIERLVDFHLKNDTSAILVCGTTGEPSTLSHDEYLRVIEIVVSVVNKKIPVLAGSGTNSTSKTIELTKEVKRLGADIALIVAPYYNRPTQKGLYNHYKAVSESVDIPIIVYNIPGRTGVNILPETIVSFAKNFKNIIGVKEASGSLDQVSEIVKNSPDNFSVWSGDDSLTLPMLAVGAKGVISVLANILPKETSMLCKSFLNGDAKTAMEIHLKFFELMKTLFIETNPVPVKTAMEMLGLCSSEVRAPLCPMEEKNKEKLKQVLMKLGLIK